MTADKKLVRPIWGFLAAVFYAPLAAISCGIFMAIGVGLRSAWVIYFCIMKNGFMGHWPWAVELKIPFWNDK